MWMQECMMMQRVVQLLETPFQRRDSIQKQRPSLEEIRNKFQTIEENIKEVEIELCAIK
jgi:hypothetical protein